MHAGTLIIALFLFTLLGFMWHAARNKRQTEELHAEGKVPYEIPKIYQRYTDWRLTRHHI